MKNETTAVAKAPATIIDAAPAAHPHASEPQHLVPARATNALVGYQYDEAQIQLIKNTVAPKLTDDEFMLFMYVCKAKNLDPLQKQVHAVKRASWDDRANNGQGGYVERMTIQTGIDGYRAIANRTGLYMPSDKLPLVEGSGTTELRVTVWVKKWSPLDKQWHEYGATAYYREYVQLYKDKKDNNKMKATSMWSKMPVNQTTKCGEALALRKGWPEELGHVYIDEEMQHADVQPVSPSQEVARGEAKQPVNASTPPKAATPSTGTQDASKTEAQKNALSENKESPNRGHGNEATQRRHTMETTVEEVIPKVKNIVVKGKKTGENRYLALRCAGDVFVYVWDDKLKEAARAMLNNPSVFTVEQGKTTGKEYLSLVEVEMIGKRPYKRDTDGVSRPVPLDTEVTQNDVEGVTGEQMGFNS